MKGEQMKRYDLEITEQRIVAIQERFVYLAHDVEREYISRPDPEEAKSLSEIVEYFDILIKGEEYHQNICDECHTSVQRSRDRVYKYKEWKAALLRLMGVE